MFDTYVAGRLKVWAEWRIRRDHGGIGFPRKVSFLKVAPQVSGYWTPEMDGLAYEVEQCVMALDQILYDAIVACYLHTTSIEQKKIFCGCTKMTYYNRVSSGHRAILGFLNDLAAGIKLPIQPKQSKSRNISRVVA